VTTQRLEAEGVSAGLAMEHAEAMRNLLAESDELGILSAAIGVVYNDLEVVRSEGTSSLVARAVEITAWVRQLERDAFRTEVHQSFVIAHSHYRDSIDMETTSLGFTPGYTNTELDEIEAVMASLSWDLANKIEDIVLP